MDEKKPRATELRVAFDGPATIAGMSPPGHLLEFTGADGNVLVPEQIEIGLFYQRDNGKPKILSRALADPLAIQTDINQLITRFGSVLVVDTNSRTISGNLASVTVLYWIRNISVAGGAWSATVCAQQALEFYEPRESPEHVGWMYALQLIAASPIPRPVGLFVDSDLGALGAINRRERSVLRDLMLPADVTLLYATSDAGQSELIGNKSLKLCDTDATRILRMIESGNATHPFVLNPALPCGRVRLWSPPRNQNGTSSSG